MVKNNQNISKEVLKEKVKEGRPKIYTLEFCLNEIKEIWKILKIDIENKYITWHDLIRLKPYSAQRISEWRKEFVYDIEFSETIKKIDGELENKLYNLGLKGQVNTTMAIFGLKNNYNWKDKTETELTGKDGTPLIPIIGVNIIDDK